MDYPFGLDPYTCRQHLLHHHYSPLIAVHASPGCDRLVQTAVECDEVSTLQLIRPYGNNAKYSVPGQNYKIVNNQLITKSYPSFPVRFQAPFDEVLTVQESSASAQSFSLTSLEVLLHTAARNGTDELYLEMFDKVVTSDKVVPFETFNHPVAQMFWVAYGEDTLDMVRAQIVQFRNFRFPKYFQLDDVLVHICVVYNPEVHSAADVQQFQADVRAHLSVFSTAIPLSNDDTTESGRPRSGTTTSTVSSSSVATRHVKVPLYEGTTVAEDVQRMAASASASATVSVPKPVDRALRLKLHEFISKHLVAHMQAKVRYWDDQFLQPKKSIASRFFSASRKMFGGRDSPLEHSGTGNYSSNDQWYYRGAPEQILRKLADWSLILKDFKYAYQAYEIIKKDYSADKAWSYVASAQAMCCISLLLSQTHQSSPQQPCPDRNTLRKIRHDIIEPYVDACLYTFKSRLSLKTWGLRTLLVVSELLLCFSANYGLHGWWSDVIERYLTVCLNDVDNHLAANNYTASTVVRALLYDRVGYSLGQCVALSHRSLVQFNETIIENMSHPTPQTLDDHDLSRMNSDNDDDDEGYYVNPNKLEPPNNSVVAGKTRYRKSALWYLLAIREWLNMGQPREVELLFDNIKLVYNVADLGGHWYDRPDLLLGFAKRELAAPAQE
ncbi:trafficking protein particle complex III-specific subunit 85 [Diutina catenulata]